MQVHLDEGTDPWGVKVERVEMWVTNVDHWRRVARRLFLRSSVRMFDYRSTCNEVWPLKPKVSVFLCVWTSKSLSSFFQPLEKPAQKSSLPKVNKKHPERWKWAFIWRRKALGIACVQEAADVINESPIALQLRYLQTLTHISAEKNSTIVFPIPGEKMFVQLIVDLSNALF